MKIPIQEMINESVQRDDKKEMTSWHASGVGSCLRGQYFQRLGVEPDEGFDDRTLRVFQCGRLFEDWVVDLIKKRDDIEVLDDEGKQIYVRDDDLDVSGYVDLMVEYEGKKKIYEIKSKHSKSFWYMKRDGKPMRHHEYQLWIYLKLLEIEEGGLVYVSKDDLAILEYPVFLEDRKLEKEVTERLRLLNKAWEEKDPSVLPLPENEWRAKYCRFHSHCLKVDKE